MKKKEPSKHSFKKTHKIKERKPIYKSKLFWFSVIFVLLMSLVVYLLIFFRYFWISSIDVLGTGRISSNDIASEVQEEADGRFVFFSRSIFIFPIAKTQEKLKEMHPAIEEVKIVKKLPNALAVNIRERSAIALWVNNQRFYEIDKFGIIFEEVFTQDRQIIRFKSEDVSANLGDQVINEKIMGIIVNVDQSIQKSFGLSAKETTINDNGQINVKFDENWEAYFDVNGDIDWQLEKLKAVLEKQIPIDRREELEYIDVRFGNLAPYRYRIK